MEEPSARSLFDRYLTAYNRLDRFLRQEMGEDRGTPFKSVVYAYLRRNPRRAKDEEALRDLAELRNVLVHSHSDAPLFQPTEAAVTMLEAAAARMENPRRAEALVGPVAMLDVGQPLTEMLALVGEKSYAQFPLYEEGVLRGILTASAVVRWLADAERGRGGTVDLDAATVGDLVPYEGRLDNWACVRRQTPLDEAASRFREDPLLVALFITKDGKPTSRIVGIITAADVAAEP